MAHSAEVARQAREARARETEANLTLDAADKAGQQAGGKRKRVRIDDLGSIPSRRPDQSPGTFSLREEFFTYESDGEEEFVDLGEGEEPEFTAGTRSAKRARMEDDVFQPATPQRPAGAGAGVGAGAAAQAAALERQRLTASQHKPKKPSTLSQVISGASPDVPAVQHAAAVVTPASEWRFHSPLSTISERTEPPSGAQGSTSPNTAVASVEAVPAPVFRFPSPEDLTGLPGCPKEEVEAARARVYSAEEIAVFARRFSLALDGK